MKGTSHVYPAGQGHSRGGHWAIWPQGLALHHVHTVIASVSSSGTDPEGALLATTAQKGPGSQPSSAPLLPFPPTLNLYMFIK